MNEIWWDNMVGAALRDSMYEADLAFKNDNANDFRFYIDESIEKDIHTSLNESLGINDDVVKAKNKVIREINNKKKTVSIEYKDETETQTIQIVVNLFEETITIECIFYYFNDQKSFDLWKRKYHNRIKGEYNNWSKFIEIGVPVISNIINKNYYYGTIQHELEHAYQMIMSGKNIPSPQKQKFYNFLQTSMSNSSNIYILGIAYIYYINFKHEEEANANALYASLESKGKWEKWMDVYKNSKLGKDISFAKKMLIMFNNSIVKPEFQSALKYYSGYNITYERLIKTCEQVINNLTWRAGRAITNFKNKHPQIFY